MAILDPAAVLQPEATMLPLTDVLLVDGPAGPAHHLPDLPQAHRQVVAQECPPDAQVNPQDVHQGDETLPPMDVLPMDVLQQQAVLLRRAAGQLLLRAVRPALKEVLQLAHLAGLQDVRHPAERLLPLRE